MTRKLKIWVGAGVFAVLIAVAYVGTGFVVIQPIGALPDGVTFWTWRMQYAAGRFEFVESPDSLCLKVQAGVSLLCRMSALSAVVGNKGRIILRLPYSDTLYLISTGGARFDR